MEDKFLITKIEPQKKRQDRFSIFIDNNFWMGVSQSVLMEIGLKKGDLLSASEYLRVEKEIRVLYGLEKMYGYLSVRDRSEKEIRQKLKEVFMYKRDERDLLESEKEEIDNIIEEVVARLYNKKFIDEDDLINQYLETAIARKYSKNKTKTWLYTKQLPFEKINELIDTVYDDRTELKLAQEISDRENIILQKKNLSNKELKDKIIKKLVSRGFSWSTAQEVTKNIITDTEDNEY